MRIARFVLAVALVAVVGGQTPRAEAATPLSSCNTTVTTSVKVTLSFGCVAGQDGIIIGAPNITIDLGGFMIHGGKTAGDFGIDNTAGHDGVKIKNGVLTEWDDAIYAATNATDNMSITDVWVTGSLDDGADVMGDGTKIKSSNFASNSDHGIRILGDSSMVTSTTVAGTGDEGISITGAFTTIKKTTLAGGADDGLLINGQNAVVSSTRALGTAKKGILVSGDFAKVTSNHAFANGAEGIQVDGESAVVDGNQVSGNGMPLGVDDDMVRGLVVDYTTTQPTGTNKVLGNDNLDECDPLFIC